MREPMTVRLWLGLWRKTLFEDKPTMSGAIRAPELRGETFSLVST